MNTASEIPEAFLPEVLAAPLVWEVDPDDQMWFRAVFGEAYVYLRMNDFPDENIYSLWLGHGQFLELEDMEPSWQRRGPVVWPPDARPDPRPLGRNR